MMGIMCVNSSINNMKTNLAGVVRVDEILNESAVFDEEKAVS